MTATLSDAPPEHQVALSGNGFGAVLSGATTAGIGACGTALGLTAVFGVVRQVHIAWLVPLIGVDFDIGRLGGFFIALTGAVAVVAGIYSIGYARREHLGAVALTMLPVFVTAMLLVPAAGSVSTFLLAWELMAISSLVLVATDHRRAQVRSAAGYYAVMTQLGFATLLLGLMVLAAAAGTDRFADMAVPSEGVRTFVFVATLLGFGSKAGLLPLHAWLPRAHPESPSPVSALMSAAMVNLGIYGLVRIDLQLLGPGPKWWGVTLLVIGAFSAMYGVLQASVATDLKRLLGYSTIENMGLVTLGLGAATLLSAAGAGPAAVIAMTAALLHLIAHAAFKSLGFLAAGSVLVATQQRDLDMLGGLAHRMRCTTTFFGIAALGASGLPLGAGFVSEWLLVQSLIHARPEHNTIVGLATPLGVGAVALTTGLGVAAMVKAFGTGFLARPRSGSAERAREAPATMLVGMAVAALGCVVIAIAPAVVTGPLQSVLDTLPASRNADLTDLGTVLRLSGMDGSISPALLAAALVAALLVVLVLARWGSRHRPEPVTSPLWACGADELTARMECTPTSFAQPLQRVFDDVLRPDTGIEVTHLEATRYHVEQIAYRAHLSDAIEDRVYAPVLRALAWCAQVIRRAHNGSVHLYLGYGALGVLIVLVVAR
ncbi:oxidoreductase [Mycobacterium marinum]|uniref:proton-conducting transporter transmembrane domain-containing protein n=1 Tax=Mycobacterium marinum TaxID=1781 RepID=UPI00235B4586|nr:oxidoreductase [Mycobacterium marinum]GJO02851.1 oxidoreductase [Mycobacterium marinum]GJO10662.1 oxidoreductase [Mycobacterium marinum]GJO17455.1 oxidoreductase [Mycobacterium marinum]GJO25783.1 oxidoreductase [Mycobacterium marinum]